MNLRVSMLKLLGSEYQRDRDQRARFDTPDVQSKWRRNDRGMHDERLKTRANKAQVVMTGCDKCLAATTADCHEVIMYIMVRLEHHPDLVGCREVLERPHGHGGPHAWTVSRILASV